MATPTDKQFAECQQMYERLVYDALIENAQLKRRLTGKDLELAQLRDRMAGRWRSTPLSISPAEDSLGGGRSTCGPHHP